MTAEMLAAVVEVEVARAVGDVDVVVMMIVYEKMMMKVLISSLVVVVVDPWIELMFVDQVDESFSFYYCYCQWMLSSKSQYMDKEDDATRVNEAPINAAAVGDDDDEQIDWKK